MVLFVGTDRMVLASLINVRRDGLYHVVIVRFQMNTTSEKNKDNDDVIRWMREIMYFSHCFNRW